MLQRVIDRTIVTARVVRVEDGYRIVLTTTRLGSSADPITYECPYVHPYESDDDAHRAAWCVLLGVTGFDEEGRPVLSVC
jgi:hypothetical protein